MVAANPLEFHRTAEQVGVGSPYLEHRRQHRFPRVDREGAVIDLLESVRRARFQAHAAPDARRDRARHDVPAPHVRRFTDVQPFHAVFPAQHRGVVRIAAGVEHRRFDADMHLVPAGPQRTTRLEPLGDQHVVAPADLLAVKPDRRVGVEAFKYQVPVPAIRTALELELPRIPPFTSFQGAQEPDIPAEKRVGQRAGAYEIQFHIAGNQRRHACRIASRQLPGMFRPVRRRVQIRE